MTLKTNKLTKRDILFIFFKRKKIIFNIVLFTVIFVTVGVYVTPLPHKATATIYVDRIRPSVPVISPDSTPLYQYLDREEVINSEIGIIRSYGVIEKAVDALNLEEVSSKSQAISKPTNWLSKLGLINKQVGKREFLIKSLQEKIKAKANVKSNLINISYLSTKDPALITKIVNGIIKAYLEKRLDMIQETASHNFFTNQMKNIKDTLVTLENKIKEFKKNRLVASLDEERIKMVQNTADLQIRLQEIEREYKRIQVRLDNLKKKGRYIPFKEDGRSYSNMNEMGLRLLDMEMEMTKLILDYTMSDNKVIKLKIQVKSLVGSIISVFQAIGEGLELEKTIIIEQINAVNEGINSLNDEAATLNQLNIDLEVARKNYLLYAEKIEQSRIAGLSNTALLNIKVIDYAVVPQQPTISRITVILFAALLSSIIGIGLALIFEYFDNFINSEDDVSYYLNIKPLASFPIIKFK